MSLSHQNKAFRVLFNLALPRSGGLPSLTLASDAAVSIASIHCWVGVRPVSLARSATIRRTNVQRSAPRLSATAPPAGAAITAENIGRVVQYGSVRGAPVGAMLRLMSGVFMPLCLNDQSWPDTIKKEFSGQLQKFMASLTETAWDAQGGAGNCYLVGFDVDKERMQGNELHITAKVDNATGREDRGYGANQLITYERRHAYIHHTPKEQAQDTIRNKLMMGLMSLPTRKQVELRRMNSYVPKRWPKEPDLFEQGASSVEQALAMPADHNKILKHFRTYPKLLKAAGLKADDIGISHVHSRKEIAANMFAMGEERDDAKVDRMYHVLHNLAVHDKLACEAFND